MQGRRRYYGSARLPRSQEWKAAGGKYYPPNTPKRQTPMQTSNPILLLFGRTVIGSELMVEARVLPTTSSGREHYPNGVAAAIPVECSLTLPAGCSNGSCPALVRARTALPKHRSTPQHGRAPMVNSRAPGSRARHCGGSVWTTRRPGAWLSLRREWRSPLAAGRAARICGTLHPPAHGQQISVSWRSEGMRCGRRLIRHPRPRRARASLGKALPDAGEEPWSDGLEAPPALARSMQ